MDFLEPISEMARRRKIKRGLCGSFSSDLIARQFGAQARRFLQSRCRTSFLRFIAKVAMEGDEFAVGCHLSIKTSLGDEIDGQIITFDRPSNILVIQGSKAAAKCNIRLLKANYIKEFTVLGKGEDPLDVKKCYLDLGSIQSREESAIRQAESEAERIGIGVTIEAQSLFDALSKTLPVRWDRTAIVVMNEVRVCSPYMAENVTGGTPAANDRVKKVVEHERKRLQTRAPGQ